MEVPACDLDGEKGAACRLVGIYALELFTTPGGRVTNVWPVLLLPDGDFVLLENPWHPEARPDPAVITRHEGERVEVIGVLRAQPPLPDELRKVNLEIACMTPIQAMTVLGDDFAAGKE
jgi:hypothetical protein